MAAKANIVLIDNYDSFTWNLVHLIGGQGANVSVFRNDKVSADEVMAMRPDAIVLSPGPCTPAEAGICLALVEKASATIPMLGVCLGHQAMGQAFGATVMRAPQPVHGKISPITHKGHGLFRGINGPVNVTRYHSLILERTSLPAALLVTAETGDGLVMAIEHDERPLHGVQFHPESIASEQGAAMIGNFLAIAATFNGSKRERQP